MTACSTQSTVSTIESEAQNASFAISPAITPLPLTAVERPSPDPREGLTPGMFDAEEAIWNLELVSNTPPPKEFVGSVSSDLAFKGNYVVQGNFNGVIIWDMSNPASPKLVNEYVCPASQSDVSVYGDLLFVSGEGLEGRLDCGTEGVQDRVSDERLRGIRIFDISDVENPEYIANVQTCRGSHTHSVLKDPKDDDNIYIYVSGSSMVRPEEELPGCSAAMPNEDSNSALFRIEVIKVPLDAPEESAIVSSPRIFDDLAPPPSHEPSPEDVAKLERMRAEGKNVYLVREAGPWVGSVREVPDGLASRLLEMYKEEQGITDDPTEAQMVAFRESIGDLVYSMREEEEYGPNQCHDITLYPEIGLAGGACDGYGLLLDISDPVNPVRIDQVADENFSYWHNATFNNDGSKILFSDEWYGTKCRANDPYEWGANAIFTITEDRKLKFHSYYKMDAVQTEYEICVAHNGSLLPVPGRDIMIQSWYEGGVSLFDWTDPDNPVEIGFHDRGPMQIGNVGSGGSWSIYWYNGYLVNSEIYRGLDILDLKANPYLTQNEIDASKTVVLDYLNVQGQPKYEWPATFALAKAYVDQLDRDPTVSEEMIQDLRVGIARAETNGDMKVLQDLASKVAGNATGAHADKMAQLAETLKSLAG
ncbi:MAG TPA: hypothetical protein DC011_03405 [Bacteroidetes bacterium]|nr:MAG: hypothetical protein CBC65_004800 [Rhodothermaceae bacterium TMED105]HBD42733.1 hypothetical protein [Bacteroidota bacterium]